MKKLCSLWNVQNLRSKRRPKKKNVKKRSQNVQNRQALCVMEKKHGGGRIERWTWFEYFAICFWESKNEYYLRLWRSCLSDRGARTWLSYREARIKKKCDFWAQTGIISTFSSLEKHNATDNLKDFVFPSMFPLTTVLETLKVLWMWHTLWNSVFGSYLGSEFLTKNVSQTSTSETALSSKISLSWFRSKNWWTQPERWLLLYTTANNTK